MDTYPAPVISDFYLLQAAAEHLSLIQTRKKSYFTIIRKGAALFIHKYEIQKNIITTFVFKK